MKFGDLTDEQLLAGVGILKIRSKQDPNLIGTVSRVLLPPEDRDTSFIIKWADGRPDSWVFLLWELDTEIVED